MHNADWDIFRLIIAVADSGSAVAAAARLGVNPSTVLRRIAKFEEKNGIRLFDRRQTGYTPTLQCAAVVETARLMEQNVNDISRDILGSDLRLEGTVSFTTTDTFLESLLAPSLAQFARLQPQIRVEVTVTNSRLNLTRHDADVALRASSQPPESLIGQRISSLEFGIYGEHHWVEQESLSTKNVQLQSLPWIGAGESLSGSPVGKWIAENVPESAIVLSVDTFPAMMACAEAGTGLAVLPCCLGDRKATLTRIGEPVAAMRSSLWLLTHKGYRNAARVRAFVDFIAPALRANRPLLEGHGG